MNGTLAGFRFATERLAFRPLSADDLDLCCGLYCDPSTMKFIGPTMSPEETKRSLERALAMMRSPQLARIFLRVDARNEKIGLASIQHIDPEKRTAELGLMLLPCARGCGYSKEALAALVTKTFELLPVDELWAEHSIEHEAAERLVRSIGFLPCIDKICRGPAGTRRWVLRQVRPDQE